MTAAADTRRTEILALLTAGDPHTPLVERVCEVSAHLLGVSGAGMCLVGGRQHQVIVHGTDPLIEGLEDMQVSLGQGPCVEAVRTGSPVEVPELEGHRPSSWPEYADRAFDRGVRALFAFPLQAGSAQVGALDLYRLVAGPLDAGQLADAVLLTEIASRSMLAQQDRIHVDGSVSALHWLTTGPRSADPGARGRAIDLGITVEQALASRSADARNDGIGGRSGVEQAGDDPVPLAGPR